MRGLYCSTLFKFDKNFFSKVDSALELGRSFVRTEYQKQFAPLLLLWKGITRFIQRRPEAPVMFGAVSISNEYRAELAAEVPDPAERPEAVWAEQEWRAHVTSIAWRNESSALSPSTSASTSGASG